MSADPGQTRVDRLGQLIRLEIRTNLSSDTSAGIGVRKREQEADVITWIEAMLNKITGGEFNTIIDREFLVFSRGSCNTSKEIRRRSTLITERNSRLVDL